MRRIIAAGLILAASSVAAFADPFNWSGFYMGPHVGLGAGQNTASFSSMLNNQPWFQPGKILVGPFGPVAGLQAGINSQNGMGVFGLEVDGAWAGMTGTGTFGPLVQGMTPQPGTFLTATESINWLATARVRAGLLANGDSMLFYLTGGLIAGGVNYAINGVVHPGNPPYMAPASSSKTKFGCTFGGGGEAVIGENWTLKAEALYFDLGNEALVGTLVPASPAVYAYSFTTTGVLFRAGLNKHF